MTIIELDLAALGGYTEAELAEKLATAEAKCLTIQDQLAAYLAGKYHPRKPGWHNRARIALRELRKRASGLKQEQVARIRAMDRVERSTESSRISLGREQKHQRFLAFLQQQTDATARRQINQAEAKAKDRADIQTFKAAAKEFLGEEVYGQLWQITNERIAKAAASQPGAAA